MFQDVSTMPPHQSIGLTSNKAKIIELIEEGKNEEFLELMNKNKLRKFLDHDGSTLVHCATKYRNIQLMKYFIENDWEHDSENKLFKTPIMLAIENMDEGMMLLLLENSVNIKHNSRGRSILKMLLDREPRKDVAMQFVQKLSDKYPIPVLARKLHQLGCTLPYIMFLKNKTLTEKFLEAGGTTNSTIYDGITALHVAASLADVENIELLVRMGADISATDHMLNTPLHMYHFNEHLHSKKIMKLLVANHCSLTMLNILGICPLFTAMVNGDVYIIKEILDMDIDFCISDKTGRTFLFFLCQNLDESIFKDLQNVMINVNTCNNYGETPLHVAATIGCVNAIEFLIKYNADPSIKNNNGDTVLEALEIVNEKCSVPNYQLRKELLLKWAVVYTQSLKKVCNKMYSIKYSIYSSLLSSYPYNLLLLF